MFLLFYKCATKVIILIYFTKLFPNYFQPKAKKIGLPVRISRNIGGTIADNHKKNIQTPSSLKPKEDYSKYMPR